MRQVRRRGRGDRKMGLMVRCRAGLRVRKGEGRGDR